ncbi:hypothetical protein DRE_03755 [Drechslerella stenobrocha 248]|uniref:Bola-like protein n=1 Tax=Drechslerella stenobrocha 248 TaxID=1043628 RepID=W7I493_9PEZI|nr:hypothetical protein DRE_03755 [Drechslerella stenobrocha 248]
MSLWRQIHEAVARRLIVTSPAADSAGALRHARGNWGYRYLGTPAVRVPTASISAPRGFSTSVAVRSVGPPPDHLNEDEAGVYLKLKEQLHPTRLEVQDISGGCGSMYAVEIESPKFRGLTTLKMHKQVQDVLVEEIKGWHGIQLKVKATPIAIDD